jgi:SNF2 family DNA or RNA helicase
MIPLCIPLNDTIKTLIFHSSSSKTLLPSLTYGERDIYSSKTLLPSLRYGERDIYITTYETLVASETFFASMVWQTIVLDEAHRVKNQAGRVRESLSRIETCFRLLLTGEGFK